jgi:signal transduction histidine kinase
MKTKGSEKNELLSMVTHEIKNPLTSITGYTMFAEDAVRNHDNALALESLQVVRSEAQRVLRLAEDLLDVAQVRAGQFSIQTERVDLKEVVVRIAARYMRMSGRRIDVIVPNSFPCIAGDSVRLGQVIENLVSNATKYSPDDAPIRITLMCTDSRVTVCVWNSGPHIPADQLPRIFKRFSRVPERRAIKGTGLGLFISRQIVELHGGTIDVLSSEGEGTCFTVELPRQVN